MKRFGTISYNIYCNFTNYGSALQTWALHQAVKKLGYGPVLVDYCPDVLMDKDPLNPYKNMWDQDAESRRMCELTMPAIRENYVKFDRFYRDCFERTSRKYTSNNFDKIVDEKLDGFVCGSDTIFCIDEFKGFDDGYYANYPQMRNRSVSYAASFGDPHFDEKSYKTLNNRLGNFRALGIRENLMLPYVKEHVNVPVARTIDPTLLLTTEDYDKIVEKRQYEEPYILLYTRRYDKEMEAYAEELAQKRKCKVVEVSLRATNAEKGHIMRYDAGVEEFLSLVKYSDCVVTNSFHGLIFAVHNKKPVRVFTREQANSKIDELLKLMNMEQVACKMDWDNLREIDYDDVFARLSKERMNSFVFLKSSLELL